MKFDHVALNVANIGRSVAWYKEHLAATVLYQDDTWGILQASGVKIALTLKKEHPAHIAFDVGTAPSKDFLGRAKKHRDGSISQYVVDPDGNAIEYIHYPSAGDGIALVKDPE